MGHVSVSLQINRLQQRIAYIESVIIRKKHRRKGLGRFMMNELERILADDEFRVLTLRTSDQVPFYESCGFNLKSKMKALVICPYRKRIEEQLANGRLDEQKSNGESKDQLNGSDVRSKGDQLEDRSNDVKLNDGKSNDGKSNDGKLNDGKSNDGKLNDGKSSTAGDSSSNELNNQLNQMKLSDSKSSVPLPPPPPLPASNQSNQVIDHFMQKII